MPCSRGGSFLTKSQNACVGVPRLADVEALFLGRGREGAEAPSMRMKALSEPDSSQTATLIAKPSCFALAVAAERMTCAVSALMLRFSKLVIPGFLLFVAWQG